jgi:hypothetical protein
MLLCNTSDNEMIKKLSWFCGNWVSFEWKYWIILQANWIPLSSYSLNSNGILNRFQIQIQLKKKVIQIDAQNIKNMLMHHLHHPWLWCWKNTDLKKHFFIPFRANSKSNSILAWRKINNSLFLSKHIPNWNLFLRRKKKHLSIPFKANSREKFQIRNRFWQTCWPYNRPPL